MNYSKGDALVSLRPMAEWAWVGGDGYSNLTWLDSKQTKPTETEIDNEVIRLNDAEPMRLLRVERDARLAKTDWMSFSDSPAMSDDWKTYRQALRDLPASASPKVGADGHLDMSSVNFPTEPS